MTKREYNKIRAILTKIRGKYDPQDINLNFLDLRRGRRGLANYKKGSLPMCWESDYIKRKNIALAGPKGVLP